MYIFIDLLSTERLFYFTRVALKCVMISLSFTSLHLFHKLTVEFQMQYTQS